MKALSRITILDAIGHPALFGRWFRPAGNWQAWVAFLTALFGLPMTEEQAATFRRHTGRSALPVGAAREAYLVVGRRGGKSRIAAVVAVFLACFRSYGEVLAPGEKGTVMLLAADRRQARVLMRYVTGLFDNIPALAILVVGRTSESITLSNRIVIEIHTASFRTVRGYTVVAAICDEIAFWQSEDSANPDTEILGALRPAMATVPGAILLCISSPYARRGAVWEAYENHYGRDGDPVLVWQADTRSMHPGLDESVIERAYARDPVAAEAEYGAQFRCDVEAFVTREMLEDVVATGRRVLPPISGVRYTGFVDPSGGAQDAMTLAIAHEERQRTVLDLVVERRPSFSPETVVAEFANILKQYRITWVTGDRFGGEWPRERFRAHGIGFRLADQSKSEIYAAFLPQLTSGRVELLDHPSLLNELLALDRRVARGGHESIDHPRGGHDDVANAVAGAVVAAARRQYRLFAGLPSAAPAPAEHCSVCGDRHPQGARCPAAAPTVAELRAGGYLYSY